MKPCPAWDREKLEYRKIDKDLPLMMATHKGGRGKNAPYKTTHVRIPVGLKKVVEGMSAEYKDLVLTGRISENEEITAKIPLPLNNDQPPFKGQDTLF